MSICLYNAGSTGATLYSRTFSLHIKTISFLPAGNVWLVVDLPGFDDTRHSLSGDGLVTHSKR
jgi:hypothetical protein